MRNATLLALCLAGTVSAQTLNFSPNGTANAEGNTNNTIPWWAQSGTYQQIHDAPDLLDVFGGNFAPLITSIGFRKDGTVSTQPAARSLDVQISMGITTATAQGASGNFATNLPTPTIVLPYTPINLPSLSNVSLPNPIGWNFPLAVPFQYIQPAGNLCWEVRFLNNTDTSSAPLDAANATSATSYTPFGGGCIATGQTSPAAIGTRSLSLTTGNYRNRLDRGAANAPAVFWIGFAPQPIALPGMCAPVEFLPVADVPGVTTATGEWDLTLTFAGLNTVFNADLFGQFVFVDPGLPTGLGVSNASRFTFPLPGAAQMARIYAAPSRGGPGNELATDGSVGRSYGLVTIFGT